MLVVVCLGAGLPIDWSADSRWELQAPQSGRKFHLGQSFSEINEPEKPPGVGAIALGDVAQATRGVGFQRGRTEIAAQAVFMVKSQPVYQAAPARRGLPFPTGQPFYGQIAEAMPDIPSDMAVDNEGLLVRHHGDEVVNLTTLKSGWKLLCNDRPVATVGTRLADWEAELGPPLQHWTNPKKTGVIHFYRAALAEIGVLVANGEVPSVMLVQPGTLAAALERTGYQPLEP